MTKTIGAVLAVTLGLALAPTFVSSASAQGMERRMEHRMMRHHMERRMMRHRMERHMMRREMMHRRMMHHM